MSRQSMKVCPQCLRRYPPDRARCTVSGHAAALLPLDEGDDPLVGTVIDGRFLILGRLGAGAMGTVYRAWQQRVRRDVALKVVSAGRVDAELRARFEREAEVTARLKSRHTVTLYDSGELPDGTLWMAMELVDGPTLEELVRNVGPIPLLQLRRLALELCASLEEAHDLGLVHRDLKPANLILGSEPDGTEALTVLDFGVVKLPDTGQGKLTRDGMTVGTLLTMSPEQIDGRRVGPTSDIYSVGATLYQLATGEPVYAGETALAIMVQHQTADPPRLAERLGTSPIVAAFDAVIQRCMRKAPIERYASARALRQALNALPVDESNAQALPSRVPRQRPRAAVTVDMGRDLDADPAQVPRVTTDGVHRRISEARLATVADPEAERPRVRKKWARWTVIGLAVAAFVFIVLDAVLGG